MRYQRGDVVEIPVLIPGKNRTENHPAIIISNSDVHNNEDLYICVMITHSDLNSFLAFTLSDNMFLNNEKAPEGKVKAHLITPISEKDIVINAQSKKHRMKSVYVDKLIDFITEMVFLER